MQRFDRHGTEIREGDRLRGGLSGGTSEWTWVGDPTPSGLALEMLAHSTVLSRADGTPVYRYKGGEDVRRGDTYLVGGVTAEASGDWRPGTYRDEAVASTWARCTLVRRAVESSVAAHVRHEETERTEDWCRHVVHCEPRVDCYYRRNPDAARERDEHVKQMDALRQQLSQTSYAEAPILGHDRNGKEVRRGMRVWCMSGPERVEFVVKAVSGTMFHSRDDLTGSAMSMRLAELVDDKAGRIHFERIDPITPDVEHMARLEERERALNAIESLCRALAQCKATYHGIPCDGAHRGERLHGFNDRCAPNGRMEWMDPGEELPEPYQIERFCRALAQPTMGERFEGFKADIGAILADYPEVTAVYDIGSLFGSPAPIVTMRCEALNWTQTVDTYQDVLESLSGLKLEIGEDFLSGRAILRGDKP